MQRDNLARLPKGVWHLIARDLSTTEILILRMLSQGFRAVFTEPVFWTNRYQGTLFQSLKTDSTPLGIYLLVDELEKEKVRLCAEYLLCYAKKECENIVPKLSATVDAYRAQKISPEEMMSACASLCGYDDKRLSEHKLHFNQFMAFLLTDPAVLIREAFGILSITPEQIEEVFGKIFDVRASEETVVAKQLVEMGRESAINIVKSSSLDCAVFLRFLVDQRCKHIMALMLKSHPALLSVLLPEELGESLLHRACFQLDREMVDVILLACQRAIKDEPTMPCHPAVNLTRNLADLTYSPLMHLCVRAEHNPASAKYIGAALLAAGADPTLVSSQVIPGPADLSPFQYCQARFDAAAGELQEFYGSVIAAAQMKAESGSEAEAAGATFRSSK